MTAPYTRNALLQDAAVAIGNGTPFRGNDFGGVLAQVAIANTATITWEAAIDGLTWVAVDAFNLNTLAYATTATASGFYSLPALPWLRARISAWTSGAVTVIGSGMPSPRYIHTRASLRGKATVEGDTPVKVSAAGVVSVSPGRSSDGAEPTFGATSVDAVSTAAQGYAALGLNYRFNGATWDRERTNMEGTLLASAARTATISSSDQTNYNGRGVHVILNVTSPGTGSITATIEGKDPISGTYYTLLAGAAVTTGVMNVYKVFPGATAAANAAANDQLPRTWRVTVTHNNANSITYSVGFEVVN